MNETIEHRCCGILLVFAYLQEIHCPSYTNGPVGKQGNSQLEYARDMKSKSQATRHMNLLTHYH